MTTIQEIVLDLCYESDKYKTICAVQNDYNSRILKIEITNQGRRTYVNKGASVFLNIDNQANESKLFDCSVNTDGSISASIPSWVLQNIGSYICNVSIIDGNSKLSTAEYFCIKVSDSPCSDEDIMNNETYDVLTNLVAKMDKAVADAEVMLSELGEAQATMIGGIDANKKAIEDHEVLASQTYETKEDASAKYDELSEIISKKGGMADWNQNNPTATDYVKNRTHYVVTPSAHEDIVWDGNIDGLTVSGGFLGYRVIEDDYIEPEKYVGAIITLSNGSSYTITENLVRLNGGTGGQRGLFFVHAPSIDVAPAGGVFVISSREDAVDPKGIYLYNDGTVYISRIAFPETVVQLDEKFIPGTIARASDVDLFNRRIEALEAIDREAYIAADEVLKAELQAKIDNIKNKPEEIADEELLLWLNETSIIEPVVSASGEIYTTNNNELFIL